MTTTPTAAPVLTLRQFVAAKLGDGITDYHAAARDIVELIPEADRDDYLVQAVIPIITEVNGQRRRAAFDALDDAEDDDSADPETTTAGPCHKRIATHLRDARPGGGSASSSLVKPGTAAQNFARRDRFRDHWTSLLDTVGLAVDGGRKRVGDMTADDLRANIDHRAELARTNLARANQFRELLAMVESQGVTTVGELTPPTRAA